MHGSSSQLTAEDFYPGFETVLMSFKKTYKENIQAFLKGPHRERKVRTGLSGRGRFLGVGGGRGR